MNKKRRTKPIILAFLAVLCAGVLAVSLYKGLVILIPQKQEQTRFNEIRQLITEPEEGSGESPYAEVKAHNSDFVGWLSIEDTVIDYPVVKSAETDPEYYLHRDFDKNYSFSGTPFIGAGCDENSDMFIIFGHNMKAGTMFGTLDSYADSSWAKEHRYISFDTPDEHRVYCVFAAFRTKLGSENEYKYYENIGDFSDEEYAEIINEIKEHSVIANLSIPDGRQQILYLSTCSYHTENGRFVAVAYRVE